MRMKFISLLGIFFLSGCHSLNNGHDSLAVQCDINGQTHNRVLLKFTNPGGIELTPEQVAQLQIQYQATAQPEETLSASPRACVVLPKGAARIKARISGESPLTAEINLDAGAATDTIHAVALEAPGFLELGLKCPKNGLLAAETLDDIVEVKKSLGKLAGYKVDINVYNALGENVLSLFTKGVQDENLALPSIFDIKGLAEGTYKLGLTVLDSYHEEIEAAAQSQCNLTVRRSCADDEDFDPATVSCVPRLCDNAYRVGAKWTEALALQRGEGRYECRLVNDKAQKTLLSHTCQAGFFKSDSSCLAAKKIDETCALLENNQVACWGTLPAKEIYPNPGHDYNYQETFQFEAPIKDFEKGCARTQSNKVHCWILDLGSNPPNYSLRNGPGTPKSWDDIIPPGYSLFRDSCGIKANNELWCFLKADGSGGSHIPIPEKIIDFGMYCAVDSQGKVWCIMGMAPKLKDQPIGNSVSFQGFEQGQGLPDLVLATRGRQYTQCALLQNGKVACWGDNQVGSVGSNNPASRVSTPEYVVDSRGRQISDIIQIESSLDGNGGTSTCALNREGRVACWGTNQYGQLASGTPGEDDEGNVIFSRFAVFLSIQLKTPRVSSQISP